MLARIILVGTVFNIGKLGRSSAGPESLALIVGTREHYHSGGALLKRSAVWRVSVYGKPALKVAAVYAKGDVVYVDGNPRWYFDAERRERLYVVANTIARVYARERSDDLELRAFAPEELVGVTLGLAADGAKNDPHVERVKEIVADVKAEVARGETETMDDEEFLRALKERGKQKAG